ncbi:hypothetical protein VTJ83DRAFT_7155 [Remersonia thermophila]|uniref:Uncharacterized protein n=1 Tax=Remersonia thermophila TaxID=72144 RepID=A0ABR4D3P0_9PEZI
MVARALAARPTPPSALLQLVIPLFGVSSDTDCNCTFKPSQPRRPTSLTHSALLARPEDLAIAIPGASTQARLARQTDNNSVAARREPAEAHCVLVAANQVPCSPETGPADHRGSIRPSTTQTLTPARIGTEPAVRCRYHSPNLQPQQHKRRAETEQPPKMKQNDVIAVIIIVLFILLAAIAFGIYHLVSLARDNMHGTVTTSSESSSSGELAD